MPKSITVAELIASMDDLGLALIDVRETGEYNTAHIPGSWSLPRRQIETRMAEMVPWQGTRIVVCDDDGRRAALAAATLESMGYSNVSVLAGGSNRWVTEGHPSDWGVNVPSKDFGERWLMTENVPELEPDELNEWMQRGDKFILVDSRTPEEHHRACIPGSRSMPGAELGLRMWQLAEDAPKDTPIVVHCAGRTRSIIGAGTLRRLGFENVYALKNGTMGWQLAGLTVEEGSDRLEMPEPSPENVAKASQTARRIAEGDGVKYVTAADLPAILARASSENVYLLDVRTREEYVAGHIPGFRHAPGGQTVQASDSYVGVKGGTIVFTCDTSTVRSSMTAGWFRRMGFPNVYVLEGGFSAVNDELDMPKASPAGYDAARAAIPTVSPTRLHDHPANTRVVFTGTSEEFSEAHVPGSRWLPRGWLELWADEIVPGKDALVVVTDTDGVGSTLGAAQLRAIGYKDVAVLEGGTSAWRKEGFATEAGLTGVMRAPDDVLPVRRSYAEMLNYLRWEEALGEKYKAH